MNYISLNAILRGLLNTAAFAIGMLPLSLAHGAAIPLDDSAPTVQANRVIPIPSSWLYFADQSKKLLFIGTHSCLGPNNPQITAIQTAIKTFKPTVAVVDECGWPIATVKHAGNTAIRRYTALPNDHDFIQQILTRLGKGKRGLVITTATRLLEIKPLLEKGLDENPPSPPHAFAALRTPAASSLAYTGLAGAWITMRGYDE